MELQNLFIAKPTLTQKSITSYENLYHRLMETGKFDYPINDTTNKKVIQIIADMPCSANSKQSLLNIAIIIKQVYKKDTELLVKQREIFKKLITEERVVTNDELKGTLPVYADLVNFLDDLFKRGVWQDYIINYLLLHYGVRNMDLNLIVTKDKINKQNKVDNFLLVQSKNILFIRNKYKTAKTYGRKIETIANKDFLYAVKQYGDGFLLGSKDHRISNNMGSVIQDKTLNKIGEGNIFKILVENSTKNGLTKLYANRGTSVSTIVESYSI